MSESEVMPKVFYRPAEVQAALGISNTKFYQLVKTGKFETRKIGRATVVPAESLNRFIVNVNAQNAA